MGFRLGQRTHVGRCAPLHGVVVANSMFFFFDPLPVQVARQRLRARTAGPGRADIAGDLAHAGGVPAMFPGMAIAARRAAGPAAMHPAARVAGDGGRPARRARAGARAAAWGQSERRGFGGLGVGPEL